MTPFSQQARILALEALLAHFPNPFLVARGIERTYGTRLAHALPGQMVKLRNELKRDLLQLKCEAARR